MTYQNRFLLLALALPACLSSCEAAEDETDPCAAGLAEASYDVGKSRFAFGSPPVHTTETNLERWTGSNGVLVRFSSGAISALANGDAPRLPPFTLDADKVKAHTVTYFKGMGVADCQLLSVNFGSGNGPDGATLDASLARGIRGIRVGESLASASFNNQGNTTFEAFFWPAIGRDVVDEAVRFRAELSDPTNLAAYKGKLPEGARGDGTVTIHHTSSGSPSAFMTFVTWDTSIGASPVSFDAKGQLVQLP